MSAEFKCQCKIELRLAKAEGNKIILFSVIISDSTTTAFTHHLATTNYPSYVTPLTTFCHTTPTCWAIASRLQTTDYPTPSILFYPSCAAAFIQLYTKLEGSALGMEIPIFPVPVGMGTHMVQIGTAIRNGNKKTALNVFQQTSTLCCCRVVNWQSLKLCSKLRYSDHHTACLKVLLGSVPFVYEQSCHSKYELRCRNSYGRERGNLITKSDGNATENEQH